MKNLHNPLWLFIINTLPILVMCCLYLGQYSIIKTLLNEESIGLWKNFGLTIGTLGILNFVYAVYLMISKREVSIFYGIGALLCYIPFIYVYVNYIDGIFPFTIPRWMVSDNVAIYVGTFLMPTLAYALFILVSHFTAPTKDHKTWMNFATAAIVPVTWYLFYLVIVPLWQPIGHDFGSHTIVIFTILATLIFLFFLVRGIYVLATKKKEDFGKKYELVWKVPICILFPIIGLAANNGFLFGGTINSSSGIFGNFNGHGYFILAILNGILLCIPQFKSTFYRLVLFVGKCITFSFTLYFFIVFLPFLPLSVIAIVVVGIGFLMLTPLVLFIVHVKELSMDFNYLKSRYSKKILYGIMGLGFLIIPIAITLSYKDDKKVLEETLDYVYSPDYNKEYNINVESLQRTIAAIRQHKDGNGILIGSNQTPYLSTFFEWLVLDNLTLSDRKITHIENIFLGEVSADFNYQDRPGNVVQNQGVSITGLSTKSTYNENQGTWTSWVDLEITDTIGDSLFTEYATNLELPEGCYIKDYYLYIGDRKEMGILAEKKSALWVFSQIRDENRDPGILYYLIGNKVAFRVFPFARNEIRKTGIQFIHKEPVLVQFDDCAVPLGNSNELPKRSSFENENLIYVSAGDKKKLPKVQREPYFHFIVDASSKAENLIAKHLIQIGSLLSKYPDLSKNAKISFTGSGVTTLKLDDNWKSTYRSQKFKGGFYLDRALKKIFVDNYQKKTNSYPVIVLVTDNLERAILDNDYSDFKMAFPESNHFYHLETNGQLAAHSLISNPLEKLETYSTLNLGKTVLRYDYGQDSVAHLSDNGEASIILKKMVFDEDQDKIKEANWSIALNLQGQWQSQLLHPEKTEKEWLSLVKNSFKSKIMTPATSYLVVENEAQKAILKKKQAQILAGNKSLDPDENTSRMSDPGILILMLALVLFLWLREKATTSKIAP
ncbi:MAG: MSEP-CTERM sorting domain-containing protein [Bacteroidota bacterium]